MKRTLSVLLLIMLSTIVISGCSSERPRFQAGQRMENFTVGPGNLSEEERQALFEERMQEAVEACQEKAEGDSCIFEGPNGEISGVCAIRETNLSCMPERPQR